VPIDVENRGKRSLGREARRGSIPPDHDFTGELLENLVGEGPIMYRAQGHEVSLEGGRPARTTAFPPWRVAGAFGSVISALLARDQGAASPRQGVGVPPVAAEKSLQPSGPSVLSSAPQNPVTPQQPGSVKPMSMTSGQAGFGVPGVVVRQKAPPNDPPHAFVSPWGQQARSIMPITSMSAHVLVPQVTVVPPLSAPLSGVLPAWPAVPPVPELPPVPPPPVPPP
jgi:hypothetical protein